MSDGCQNTDPGQKVFVLRRRRDTYASLLEDIRHLRTEVDCRIEHGAESNGHLEYVRNSLDQILDAHQV